MGTVQGIVRIGGDPVHPGGHGVGGGLGIVQHPVHLALKTVEVVLQCVQAGAGGLQGDVRGHLAHDAAHVLAALDGAVVDAAGHVAVLPPGHAAHIVAHMGITHGAAVGAALDDTGGVAGNAAGIGGNGVFRHLSLGNILTFQDAVHGVFQVFQIGGTDVRLIQGGIHRRHVCAAEQGACVLPGNAAGELLAPHYAGRGAVRHHAAFFVPAHDAAHGVLTDDGAGIAAVFNAAVVDAGHTAHLALGALRGSLTHQGKVPHHGPLLDLAEKAVAGGAPGQFQIVDPVALAVKGAGKDRNGHLGARRVDIRRQHHGQVLGIGVGGTAVRKIRQLLQGSDG